MTNLTNTELLEIIEYLRVRAKKASYISFGNLDRDTGISSNAMVDSALDAALTGFSDDARPQKEQYPYDGNDLDACARAYKSAPSCLQNKMKPILDKYIQHIQDSYGKGAVKKARRITECQ